MSVQVAKLEKLTKDNYASWKYKVTLILKAKELWHIVVNDKPSHTIKEEDRKGKKKESGVIEDAKDWNKKDAEAMVILLNILSSSLIPLIKHCNITKEMWDTFEKIFSNVSSARKMQLKEQLQNVKMDRNMTIMDYVGKIMKIVDDLA